MDRIPELSRRKFLIGVVAVTAGGVVVACSSAAKSILPTLGATSPVGTTTPAGAATPSLSPTSATTSPSSAGTTNLSLWKSPLFGDEESFWTSDLAQYAQQTGVHVSFRLVPWANFLEIYTAAFVGSQPPDVWYCPPLYVKRFADAGDLADLNTTPGIDLTQLKAVIPADFWNGFDPAKGQLGVPCLRGGNNMVWNTQHFQDAGLDPTAGPATWDDVRAYAKKLNNPSKGRWGYATLSDDWNDALNVVPNAIIDYGGDLTNADDSQWIANGPGYVAGLEIQRAMFVDDKTCAPVGTWNGLDIYTAFLDGKISMMQALPFWVVPQIKTEAKYKDFPLGVGATPHGPMSNQSVNSCGYMAISAACKDKPAAYKLIEWMLSPEISSPYYVASGVYPVQSNVNPFANDPINSAFFKNLGPLYRTPLTSVNWGQTLCEECTAAFLGTKTSKEALDSAASTINNLMKSAS